MRRLANITINKQKIWFPFTYFIKYYTDKKMCIFNIVKNESVSRPTLIYDKSHSKLTN